MITITKDQAASRFSHWLALIAKGEEVLVLDDNRPVARITGCPSGMGERPQVGTITSGPVRATDDCFLPMSDAELKEWGL